MKNIKLIFLLPIFACCIVTCKKDSSNFPIEFTLQTTNSKGEVKTMFSARDTIHFQLIATNKTNQQVNLENYSYDLICNSNSSLFRVYNAAGQDMGRPCSDVACAAINIMPFASNATSVYDMPWPSKSTGCQTGLLSPGVYTTALNYTFKSSSDSYNPHLKISFTVTN